MKIYSAFDLPESKPSNAGEEYRYTYRWAEDENGKKILVEDEKINIRDEIESFHDETKIENIIQRATYSVDAQRQLMGDEGMNMDLTALPENLMQAQNIMVKAKTEYAKLTDKQKAEFGSMTEYMATAGTEEWAKRLGYINKKPVEEEKHESE